jgi:hypothetical protein
MKCLRRYNQTGERRGYQVQEEFRHLWNPDVLICLGFNFQTEIRDNDPVTNKTPFIEFIQHSLIDDI